MKNNGIGTAAFVLAGIAFCVSGCAPSGTSNPTDSTDPVASSSEAAQVDLDAEPSTDGLAGRSQERWALIAQPAEDWIQAYEYMPPTMRATFGLYEFLDGKAHHHYKDVQATRVLAMDGSIAYTEVNVTWWTTHPQVVDAVKGNSEFGDVLEIVEEWEWEDGQWWWIKNHRRNEFFRAHPEFLKKD